MFSAQVPKTRFVRSSPLTWGLEALARHDIYEGMYLCIIGAQGENRLDRALLRQRMKLAQMVSSAQLVAPPSLA